MKKLLKVFFAVATMNLMYMFAFGQVLFEENFNYPAGDSLRGHGWNITGTSTVFPRSSRDGWRVFFNREWLNNNFT